MRGGVDRRCDCKDLARVVVESNKIKEIKGRKGVKKKKGWGGGLAGREQRVF